MKLVGDISFVEIGQNNGRISSLIVYTSIQDTVNWHVVQHFAHFMSLTLFRIVIEVESYLYRMYYRQEKSTAVISLIS